MGFHSAAKQDHGQSQTAQRISNGEVVELNAAKPIFSRQHPHGEHDQEDRRTELSRQRDEQETREYEDTCQ